MNIMQLTQTIQFVPVVTGRTNQNRLQPTLPGLEPDPKEQAPVTNRQIAEILSNIADILETQRSNPYRIQAYRNAARGILDLSEPAHIVLARGAALPVPGLGERLRKRINELVETGTMTFYQDLYQRSLPEGVRALLAIHFVGIRTAIRLYEELDIDSPEKLWHAARQQRIRALPGFGPRSEARLKESAEYFLAHRKHSQTPLDGAA